MPPSTSPPAPEQPAASALFVLGDSLSDVGNAGALADYLLSRRIVPPTVGLCNPADVLILPRPCDDLFYRQSRVSDGPVAVEYLGAHVGVPELVASLHVVPSRPEGGTNYAVAGAKARGPELIDLDRQVDMLLLEHAPLAGDALYVVMIGGNDAIDALQAATAGGTAAAASATIVSSAVAAIGENVARLLDLGARQVIVANVPDLAALPAVRNRARGAQNEATVLAAAKSITESFDRELDALLDDLEANGRWTSPTPLQLTRFDLRAALREAEQAIEARGGNVLAACFDSDAYRDSVNAERRFDSDCGPAAGTAPRFADFAYWDGIHPTGAAHAAIGAALIEALLD